MSAGKKIWNVSWRVLICLLLLGWIFHAIFLNEAKLAAEKQQLAWSQLSRWEQWQKAWHLGPAELWHNLTVIHTGALGLSLLVMGATLLVGVLRWQMVLKVHGLNLGWGRATEISLVAHFFNSFLLGSAGGDLMKAYYAARETHHKKTEAVVTVFVDRLIGFLAILLFACLMMVPNMSLLFAHDKLRPIALFILGMTLVCLSVAGVAFWSGVSKRVPGARGWLRRLPKGEWLERSLDSCRQFRREPFFFTRTLSISMVLNALTVLQVFVLSWGLGLKVSPVVLLVIVPIIGFIAAMPITPSGLGVRENLFVIMMADPFINVPATSALSLSLLAFAGSLFWSLVGGVVYLTLKQRHHLSEEELAARTEP